MEATSSATYRSRNGYITLAKAPGERLPVLDSLLKEAGVQGYRARAKFLDSSLSVLHRAFTFKPVSAEFIHAVRTRFPHVPYERIFREEVTRHVAADAARNRAA
jgi:hypothetical protein